MHAATAPLTADKTAAVYKAAGDPLRLQILRVLGNNSYSVLELCQIFNHKQSGLSHHLKVLATAGLVETRREGNSIYYRRPTTHYYGPEQLKASILHQSQQLSLGSDVFSAIAAVHKNRQQQCQQFFSQLDPGFNEHQERIADTNAYYGATLELVDWHLEPGDHHTALEIGPGDGGLLPALSQRFKQVVALDTSAEMLARARQQAIATVNYVLGDIHSLAAANHKFDCIVYGDGVTPCGQPGRVNKQRGATAGRKRRTDYYRPVSP